MKNSDLKKITKEFEHVVRIPAIIFFPSFIGIWVFGFANAYSPAYNNTFLMLGVLSGTIFFLSVGISSLIFAYYGIFKRLTLNLYWWIFSGLGGLIIGMFIKKVWKKQMNFFTISRLAPIVGIFIGIFGLISFLMGLSGLVGFVMQYILGIPIP